MIMQVLSYTPEQISQLAPKDRATFIQLVSPLLSTPIGMDTDEMLQAINIRHYIIAIILYYSRGLRV